MMEVSDLPFLNTGPNGEIDAWIITASGDYDMDCKKGAAYARALVDHVAGTEDTPLFARVVREFAKDRSGVGVGFMAEISDLASAGLMHSPKAP